MEQIIASIAGEVKNPNDMIPVIADAVNNGILSSKRTPEESAKLVKRLSKINSNLRNIRRCNNQDDIVVFLTAKASLKKDPESKLAESLLNVQTLASVSFQHLMH